MWKIMEGRLEGLIGRRGGTLFMKNGDDVHARKRRDREREQKNEDKANKWTMEKEGRWFLSLPIGKACRA